MSTLEAVRAALTERVRVTGIEGDEIVTLPLSFSNGNLIRLRVRKVESDRWLVSDRGVAASELAMAGVDLDVRQVAADSWAALISQMRVEHPVMQDVGIYDLAGIATAETLGGVIREVAQTAARAEMLRVLAPGYKARSFKEKVLATAGAHDLAITPNAPMPTRHGGRRSVTVRVESGVPVYVQAISAKQSPNDGFDKAQAMFSSAVPPKDQLVAVLADRVRLERWQRETLEEFGRPVAESQFDHFLSNLVA